MIFQYVPTREIIVDQVVLAFSEDRKSVRSKLGLEFKEDDQIIDLGDEVEPLFQRRDIYQGENSFESFFFLNYYKDDKLRDIEVHNCENIKIFDIIFDFKESIDNIAMQLERYSDYYKKGYGEYLFFDLKVVIVNKAQMGGTGNSLGYIYCTSDITHLENESS